jgi:hypothetical protein
VSFLKHPTPCKQLTTVEYLGSVHNCTFEISDPDLGMSYRSRELRHACTSIGEQKVPAEDARKC